MAVLDTDGNTISIGSIVEFKSDIEQVGKVVAFKRSQWNNRVDLILEGDFQGEYIGGTTRTTMPADDCWVL